MLVVPPNLRGFNSNSNLSAPIQKRNRALLVSSGIISLYRLRLLTLPSVQTEELEHWEVCLPVGVLGMCLITFGIKPF